MIKMIRIIVDVRLYRTHIWWVRKDAHFGAYSIEDVTPGSEKILKRSYSEMFMSTNIYYSTVESLAFAMESAMKMDLSGSLEIIVNGSEADEVIKSITNEKLRGNYCNSMIIDNIKLWKKTRGDVTFASGRSVRGSNLHKLLDYAAEVAYGDEYDRGYNHTVYDHIGDETRLTLVGKPELRSKAILKIPKHAWF